MLHAIFTQCKFYTALNALRQSSYIKHKENIIITKKTAAAASALEVGNSFYRNLITIIYHFWLCLAVEGKRKKT